MKLHTGILLIFILSTPSAQATNYYVSTHGSNSNDGSKDAPFFSIAKASSLLFAGDTCFIMEGTYREVLMPVRSGTTGMPIVYKAYGNDSVVVSAADVVEGWELFRDQVYKTSVPMSLGRQNMLYFNGKAMERARWPNNEDDNRFTIDASPIEGGSASTIVDNDIPDLNWTGGYMWYLAAHSGTSWTRPINGYDPGSHTLFFDAVDITKWPFKPQNPTYYENGNWGRIFLFGTLDALDYPGEWFFDSNTDTLYFQAPGNVNPGINLTEIATRTNTIRLATHFVHVDGIHAFGGRVYITGNNCVVRNGTFRHCLEILDELNNTNAQMGTGSFTIESSNTLIENNIIEYGSSNGIALLASWKGSKNNTITNNVIRHFNTIGIHSGPIRSNCTGTRVIGNSIYSCGRDGVYLSGSNSELAYNDIYGCMKINNDGGVFYTVGNQSSKNSTIHHNWCHDSFGPFYADGRAAGIYLDNNSKGYDVHHNVVWNVTWTAVQMNIDSWYNSIFNNSFWQVGGAMGVWLNGGELIDNKTYNNYSSVGSWKGNDMQANIIDPLSPFKDVSVQDFTPNNQSVLINRGVYIDGFTNQVMGDGPDVGAYEYGLSPWRPGVNRVIGGDTLSNLKIDFLHPDLEQVFAPPADIVVEADNVNGEEGVVMSLYLDEQFVGSDSAAPYRWEPGDYTELSGLPAGVYELTIQASDINTYAASSSITFSVIASNIGDEFILGNKTGNEATKDIWTSNMVIDKTDTFRNKTDSMLFLQVNDFTFYAQALADPVTPFIVRVNGLDDYTVLMIGDTRNREQYVEGENSFMFRDEKDTTLLLAPGETIAVGFLDAMPNGWGGGQGAVIPYDEVPPVDRVWYSGGPSAYHSGSIVEGDPPVFETPPRTFYLRNYRFNIGFTLTDSIQTSETGMGEDQDFTFSIYPNPVGGSEFCIRAYKMELPASLSIYSLQGRLLFSHDMEQEFLYLSSSLVSAPGAYVIKIEADGKTVFGKLIRH